MTQPQQMTPEQALDFLDINIVGAESPLNAHVGTRSVFINAQVALQVLRLAIAPRVGTDGKPKPPKPDKETKARTVRTPSSRTK